MGKFPATRWLKDQFVPLPKVSKFAVDLSGKTVVIIGANTGLGLEAARHFARMKPGRLILGCRNLEKASKAAEDVKSIAGCETVEPWTIDLSNFKSVTAFADRYAEEGGGRLDLLVMNAGVNSYKFTKTDDDWETTLQVNHLSTCLLTFLLLPYLKNAPASLPAGSPRIVLLASETHYFISPLKEADSPNILEKLNNEEYSAKYYVTKLFNIFFVHAMAARIPTPSADAPGLVVTSVNPGWCRSQLMRQYGGIVGALLKVGGYILARSVEMGSRAIVWASVANPDGGAPLHGHYVHCCRVEEESDYSLSEEGRKVQERLWKETLDVLIKVDPRLETIVKEHLPDTKA
ncbi:hypothetical protein M422DRAFT_69867 [Sphaerobolus stellatus SS14]|uniref:NAD(P)-binding protein n=1 Tax=Sphaerobolus stellatus (strain SS14) TaxID=990650 RepID=A0A0C9UMH1_SPHS4|nr:hypothetical protein M422DRAFT_71916 [Sphaerobolus stellatus SS14]KIJ35733.1 hypothetical protein M422DRAFT_69867 [Sphaerobolus stellatus SS14]